MHFLFTTSLSLAPGFSPVLNRRERDSRFNGFSQFRKPLKRLMRQMTAKSPG
jgi:hypothetical protein